MLSNVDNSLDRSRQLFWRSMLMSILIALAAGVTLGICRLSVVAGVLTYILLLPTLMAPVGYKLYRQTAAESVNS